jgi:lipoate-protein ligase A
LEERLVRQIVQESTPAKPQALLFLRRNAPCVVVGRNQHAESEVNLRALERDKVCLLRRKTGGGCVYQDLGNANYTFVRPDAPDVRDSNNAILLGALGRLGVVDAAASGRNDLTVRSGPGMHKVSGAAFRLEGGRMVHHGTVLVNTELNALVRYLTPSRAKLTKHGVTSVRSRVCNLVDVAPDATVDLWDTALEAAVIAHLRPHHVERRNVHKVMAQKDEPLLAAADAYVDPRWILGHTSTATTATKYEHQFAWGLVTAHVLERNDGCLESLELFSDTLTYELVEEAHAHLVHALARPGHRVTRASAFASFSPTLAEHAGMACELHAWLASTSPA